ncbi:MAG: peptidoglycan-binding protein [Paracoccaceae bacterium]|nr:peptidoglycan-binding protein [Paracoccaceae bacterium]
MNRSIPLAGAGLAVLLSACANPGAQDPLLKTGAIGPQSLSADLVHSKSAEPPSARPGECWADAVTPAVFETDTIHQLVQPAKPAKDGQPAQPAEYQTITRQRIVQDRQNVWFRTPCPTDVTPDFIGTLQRALLARGYYNGPLTGAMDAPTQAALRRFQAERGLDSAILSLGAARMLGLFTYNLGQPQVAVGTPEANGDATTPAAGN